MDLQPEKAVRTPAVPPEIVEEQRPSIFRRIVRFPLVRILIALAWVMGCVAVAQAAAVALSEALGHEPGLPIDVWTALPLVVVAHVAYAAYVAVVERRPLVELARRDALSGLGLGAAIGALLLALTVGVLALLGYYAVDGVNPWRVMMPALAASIVAGYVEEVMFRGIIFRIAEEGLGSWMALAISSLVFGFAHASSPGATIVSTISIVIEAGVLLGATYMWSRNLWMPIGMHFAWNFTQAGFGINVSGHELAGRLDGRLSGPDLLSGGAFGAEASIFAVLACGAVTAWLILRAVREGKVVPPSWKRRPPDHGTIPS